MKNSRTEKGGAPRRGNLLFAAIALLLAAAVVEAGARALLLFKESINERRTPSSAQGLGPHKMPDPEHPGNFVLRPGVSFTFNELLETHKAEGRVLAVESMLEIQRERGIDSDETVLAINSLGFKGPEIGDDPLKVRIVAIGDSCTFGSFIDKLSYPRSLEKALRARGVDVEVINAGIPGHAPRNTLYNIDKLKALKPDIAVVYIGWNGLYAEQIYFGLSARLGSAKVVRKLINMAGRPSDPVEAALWLYKKPKRPNPRDPRIKTVSTMSVSFMDDVSRIVSEMKSAGSETALMTLAGLYAPGAAPSEEALKKGHLPEFTDNPFVLAALTDRYNKLLRETARKEGCALLDAASWSLSEFVPRDDFFSDSVHLTVSGEERLAEFVADGIESSAREISERKRR